jgi:hypothetical protein
MPNQKGFSAQNLIGLFGKSCEELFRYATVSGADVFKAYSENNFGKDGPNPFHDADLQRKSEPGPEWQELFRDIVLGRYPSKREAIPKDYIPILYIANRDTEKETEIKALVPPYGLWVPSEEGIFYPGTVIPFKTIPFVETDDKGNIAKNKYALENAAKELKNKEIPLEEISSFYSPITHSSGYRHVNPQCPASYVIRCFSPNLTEGGRFAVMLTPFEIGSGKKDLGTRIKI